MRVGLAGLLLTLLVAQAADSPQAVVDKAIQARGGQDQLAQIKAFQAKVKGQIYVPEGVLPFTATIQSQVPSHFKHVMDFQRYGQAWKQTQVYTGDKAWIRINDGFQALDEELVEALQRMRYAERLTTLVILKDKAYQPSSLGDSKVEGQDVAGVLVNAAKKTPVQLFFDKSTGLLVKTEHRQKDPRNPMGEEITQESFYHDYRIPDTTTADEQSLKTAGIDSNGSALLEYFRRCIATPFDAEKVRALIGQLGDDSFELREKASQALIAIGAPAVPFLRQAAKSTDPEVVLRAELCLQAILKDPAQRETEPVATIAAARMLARQKPAGAAEALLAFLPRVASPDVDREVRYALRVLGKANGQPDPALKNALEDKDPRRRQAVAEALGRAPLPPGSRLLLPDVKYPMNGTVLRQGKKFMDWEILEVIFLNHLDDKEFTMP